MANNTTINDPLKDDQKNLGGTGAAGSGAGSGLMLNGVPVDPKTLNPRSLTNYNGVLVTPEQLANAQAEAGNVAVGGVGGNGAYASAQLPSATSAESYINDWQNAMISAAQQAYKTAYDANVLTLNAAGEKIPAQYQAARNQTAAQSETQRGNFNEYAAASGLNSGAGGQASLAMSNQLQGDLSGITQAEATAKADLELQRAQLATKYQNDIAQAVADGNSAKALALYNDFVRVDDSLVSTARAQADNDFRTGQANQSKADNDRAEKIALADNLAQYGNFSGYKGIYDDAQIASMEAAWKLAHSGMTPPAAPPKPPDPYKAFIDTSMKNNDFMSLANNINTKGTPGVVNQVDTESNGMDWVVVPGYGRQTWAELVGLVEAGKVKETYNPKTGKYSYTQVR